ncbi:MAG: hypothetical protein ACOCVL_01005 [Candidatus Sumerlaeota bacterium]
MKTTFFNQPVFPLFLIALLFGYMPAEYPSLAQEGNVRPSAPPQLPTRPTRRIDRERLEQLAERRRGELERQAKIEEKKKELEEQRKKEMAQRTPSVATSATAGNAASAPVLSQASAPDLVMMIQPFHQKAVVGERLITEASVYTKNTQSIDAVRIYMHYPPQVRPLKVFDYALANLVKPGATPEISLANGLLVYEADFAEPVEFTGRRALLQIVWEATGQADQERFSLGVDHGDSSAVLLNGKNLLLSEKTRGVPKIDGTFSILERRDGNNQRFGRATSAGHVVPAGATDGASDTGVGLRLVAAPGRNENEYIVDILLDNPSSAALSEVRLNIAFDPEKMEVYDWDTDNWIKRGVNIYDGHAHDRYPFRNHLVNRVDNRRGRIHYHMKTENPGALPSGSLARVYVRATSDDALASMDLFADPADALFGQTNLLRNDRSVLNGKASTILSVVR